MRYGSDSFYSTVATLLPIFAFLTLYQRRRGFFIADMLPDAPPGMPRMSRLVRWLRNYYVIQAIVLVLLTFVSLFAGEILCLLALTHKHGETPTIYQLVWICILAQFGAVVFVEYGNLTLATSRRTQAKLEAARERMKQARQAERALMRERLKREYPDLFHD